MSYFLAPSLVKFRAEVNQRWPQRDKASDGWIGDAAHRNRVSDHNPDKYGIVRAFDTDEDLDGVPSDGSAPKAWEIAEHLRKTRDPRIKYVIYEGRMFSSYASGGVPAWTWRIYNGSNQHRKHIHVSILGTHNAAYDTRPWLVGLGTQGPPGRKPPARGLVTVNVRMLEQGDKGGDVKSLQAMLVARAGQYVGKAGPDGDFGRATDSAVRNVQKFFGLHVDGIVGAKTWPVFFL